MTTIGDIAGAAGVSRSTVSWAVSGKSLKVDGIALLDVMADDLRVPTMRAMRDLGALNGRLPDTRGADRIDLDFGEAAGTLVDHSHERGHQEILGRAAVGSLVKRIAWGRDFVTPKAQLIGPAIADPGDPGQLNTSP